MVAGARAPAGYSCAISVAGGFRKRERRSAEGALGEHPAEIPMRPPATRAVVHFILAVHGMVAPCRGIERIAAGFDRIKHRLPFLPLPRPTSVESLGFRDNPQLRQDCRLPATACVSPA